MTDGLRAALKAGKPQIGTYVTFPSPEIVELFAAAGMDYVVIDLQHSSPDWQTLAHMIRAAEARDIAPIVRVYSHEPALLLKVLELGAEGISLPGVRNAADIRAAVDAIYYPPVGQTRRVRTHPRRGLQLAAIRVSGACEASARPGADLGADRRSRGDLERRGDRLRASRSGSDRRGSRRSFSCAWPAGADRSPDRHRSHGQRSFNRSPSRSHTANAGCR